MRGRREGERRNERGGKKRCDRGKEEVVREVKRGSMNQGRAKQMGAQSIGEQESKK